MQENRSGKTEEYAKALHGARGKRDDNADKSARNAVKERRAKETEPAGQEPRGEPFLRDRREDIEDVFERCKAERYRDEVHGGVYRLVVKEAFVCHHIKDKELQRLFNAGKNHYSSRDVGHHRADAALKECRKEDAGCADEEADEEKCKRLAVPSIEIQPKEEPNERGDKSGKDRKSDRGGDKFVYDVAGHCSTIIYCRLSERGRSCPKICHSASVTNGMKG